MKMPPLSVCRAGVPAVLMVAAGAACGQITPAPELGLWESTPRMTLNGRDMMGDMRKSMAAALEKMPPAQRAQMEAMIKSRAGGDALGGGGPVRQCLVAKDLAKWSDPEARLRELEKEAPTCKFQPVSDSGSTVQFKGACADPKGFTGDVTGTFTMKGPRESSFVYTGKGTMAARPGMPAGAGAGGGPVDMRVESAARWVAADCGDVKPRP